jgi:hypothetical protein
VHGIDCDETYAPIPKMDFVHLELAIVANNGWEFHLMDVRNEFLHGDLSKDIYMEKHFEHSTHPKILIKFCHFLGTTCFLHLSDSISFWEMVYLCLFSCILSPS